MKTRIAVSSVFALLLAGFGASALAQDSRFFTPAYWGPFGWLGLDLSGNVDWEEVTELVEESYRNTAPKKLVAELEASGFTVPEHVIQVG